MKEITRLVKFLNKLSEDGYCIFYDFSGHVSWFDVKIVKSREQYDNADTIYGDTISLRDYEGIALCNSKIKARVDRVIKEISQVISNFEEESARATIKKEQDEKRLLEELKRKYETKK